jgi:hypothetical protein
MRVCGCVGVFSLLGGTLECLRVVRVGVCVGLRSLSFCGEGVFPCRIVSNILRVVEACGLFFCADQDLGIRIAQKDSAHRKGKLQMGWGRLQFVFLRRNLVLRPIDTLVTCELFKK